MAANVPPNVCPFTWETWIHMRHMHMQVHDGIRAAAAFRQDMAQVHIDYLVPDWSRLQQ